MLLRLILFVLGGGALVLIPGAGLGYLGWRMLKPYLARRRLLKEAQARALKSDCEYCPDTCLICSHGTDPRKDAYLKGSGWFHPACKKSLLQGGDR